MTHRGTTKEIVLAPVGMPGSGKSVAARFYAEQGFSLVYVGGLVVGEVAKRGLPPGEASERSVREGWRKQFGMDALAKLSFPQIERALRSTGRVVIDGLYSTEELEYFRNRLGKHLVVIAIYASPATRHQRLHRRRVRPLTFKKATERDFAEVKNSGKGGPIALADYTIINESSTAHLRRELSKILHDSTKP